MRYEVYESVGEVTNTKDYEGTPEEIAQLINLLEKKETVLKSASPYRPSDIDKQTEGVIEKPHEHTGFVAIGDNGPQMHHEGIRKG